MRNVRAVSYAKYISLRIWRGVREWCGDAAYDRYIKSRLKHSCGATPLSREEFYLQQLQKKYSKVSRCC